MPTLFIFNPAKKKSKFDETHRFLFLSFLPRQLFHVQIIEIKNYLQVQTRCRKVQTPPKCPKCCTFLHLVCVSAVKAVNQLRPCFLWRGGAPSAAGLGVGGGGWREHPAKLRQHRLINHVIPDTARQTREPNSSSLGTVLLSEPIFAWSHTAHTAFNGRRGGGAGPQAAGFRLQDQY